MNTAIEGNATEKMEDDLLRQLKEEQKQVRTRTRRLLKDYRTFIAGPEGGPGALFPRRDGPDKA